MHYLRAFWLLLLLGFVASEELKSDVTKMTAVDSATGLINAAQTKSRTEKRDSDSKQTALLSAKANDEPFRPIFGANVYSKDSAQLFRPTTVRYVAADAVAPQTNYYDKAELSGGIQYAMSEAEEVGAHSVPAATMMGGITYASSAYRAPYNGGAQLQQPQQQQQQVHHQQHRQQHLHALQAMKLPAHYSAASAAQIQAFNEDMQQQQQQQHAQLQPPHHHHPHPAAGPAHLQLNQGETERPASHPLQYVIAIPLSYVRQLQQQLSGGGGYAPLPQSHPHPLMQAYHGMYRAEAPPQYTAQYIQLPVGSLGLYHKQQAPVPVPVPVQQQQLYYMQPPPPQQHHHYQHPHQHQAPIYAYALQQHQPEQLSPPAHYHHHHLHQPQSQPQHAALRQQEPPSVVRIGASHAPGVKSSAKLQLQPSTPSTPRLASAPTQPHPSSAIVHYNPIYVQPPPPPPPPATATAAAEQAAHAHAHAQSFARFVQTYPDDVHSSRGQYFVMPQAAPQFYAVPHQPQHRFKLTYQPQGPIAAPPSAGAQSIPIFSHSGSVHYGTHLYHPHAHNYAQAKVLETQPAPSAQPAVNHHQHQLQQHHHQQHQQQQQQPPHQQQQQLQSHPSAASPTAAGPAATASSNGAARSSTLVKYP